MSTWFASTGYVILYDLLARLSRSFPFDESRLALAPKSGPTCEWWPRHDERRAARRSQPANLRSVPLNLTDARDVAASCKYAASGTERCGERSVLVRSPRLRSVALGCARCVLSSQEFRGRAVRFPSFPVTVVLVVVVVVVVGSGRLARCRPS